MDQRERISHAVRRLSLGVHPEIVDAALDVDDAVSRMLDLSTPAPEPPALHESAPGDRGRDTYRLEPGDEFRTRQMVSTTRPIEERLIWFWSDHFATSMGKVRSADLMWRQHLTIRRLATRSFADLLHAMAKDGAMLVYLDGLQNRRDRVNENYAREVMELHTLGRGNYTQEDVRNAARACTGWVVNTRTRPRTVRPGLAEGDVYFAPGRHDAGSKTVLGTTGDLDLDGFIDVLLGRPQTASFVAAKLYRDLVGLVPEPDVVDGLATAFRRDWSIMTLVETIAAGPRFRGDEAVRAKVRTPLEKAVGLSQAAGEAARPVSPIVRRTLNVCGYQPWAAPNPAGFPKSAALLGPAQLVHMIDLLGALDAGELPDLSAREALARFGLFTVSANTLEVVEHASTPLERFAFCLLSPEFALI